LRRRVSLRLRLGRGFNWERLLVYNWLLRLYWSRIHRGLGHLVKLFGLLRVSLDFWVYIMHSVDSRLGDIELESLRVNLRDFWRLVDRLNLV